MAMNASLYHLKPRFQAVLRPLVQALHAHGVTANQVTVVAAAVSVALGLWLHAAAPAPQWFALIPLWMFLRMALNAIDGMLAREHGQRSLLGAYLNELADLVSDAALYLPFAGIAPFQPVWVGAVVLLAACSEMAGVLGQALGASRRYDGPMGKSDRALVFGALGAWVAAGWARPDTLAWVLPAVAALTACSVANRVRAGLRELSDGKEPT
jgi:CDP-diacylglycerol--glycerol-3-phosphate 3-phosphatidyltransferase